jgi:HipA-like protein
MNEGVLRARQVVSGRKRGSSRPVVIETDEGRFFTKLRGAAQGLAALVAEVIVAELAEALGLPVPRRALVALDEALGSADRDAELMDLLTASRGINLGFAFLEGARELEPGEAAGVPDDFACRALWLDALVLNMDRTPRNPNVMIGQGRRWLIDHGAALGFHYRWSAVREDSPRWSGYPLERHLFADRQQALPAWDEGLAARLSREVLERAVGQVPEGFLRPLLSGGVTVDRRRRAYVAYLWKRLKAPRPFARPLLAAQRGL